MNLVAVILAAGKGTRMKSNLPKVLHKTVGKPMIKHVVDTVEKAGIFETVLVLGHKHAMVEEIFSPNQIKIALQQEQLGTGHALLQAESLVDMDSSILVLAGDIPLLQPDTLEKLINFHNGKNAIATVMTAYLDNPTGYGRIIRNERQGLKCIVEEKDALPQDKNIKEINSGIYFLKAQEAFAALRKIGNDNSQGEYYLTDILEILLQQGHTVEAFLSDKVEDMQGINDRIQLAQAEKIMRQRINKALMASGVTLIDPESTFIESDVSIGMDTIIYPGNIIEGDTQIGDNCILGPSNHIINTKIGDNVQIDNSRINEAEIGDACTIGPFAYLRPGTILARGVKVGDFVELKKSIVGNNAKIPHLSYIGDATIGSNVNIGAGTITCNYDGVNKYPTIIEEGAFIGSNSNLVAPIKICANAIIGAGSTLTRDVPEAALGIERAVQKIIPNYRVRFKHK